MKHITKFEDFINESTLNETNAFAAELYDYINDMYNYVTKAKNKAKTQEEKNFSLT